MDIWDVRREALIPVWQERIRECRASGLGVKAWCARNNISRPTYYHWEKICLSKAEQNQIKNETSFVPENALVKFNPERLPANPEQTFPVSTASAELVIHCGCVSMDISPQMPVAKVAELVSALNRYI